MKQIINAYELEKVKDSLNTIMWWILGLWLAIFFGSIIIEGGGSDSAGFTALGNLVIFILRFVVAGKISTAYHLMNSQYNILLAILAFFFPLIMIWITTPKIKRKIIEAQFLKNN